MHCVPAQPEPGTAGCDYQTIGSDLFIVHWVKRITVGGIVIVVGNGVEIVDFIHSCSQLAFIFIYDVHLPHRYIVGPAYHPPHAASCSAVIIHRRIS